MSPPLPPPWPFAYADDNPSAEFVQRAFADLLLQAFACDDAAMAAENIPAKTIRADDNRADDKRAVNSPAEFELAEDIPAEYILADLHSAKDKTAVIDTEERARRMSLYKTWRECTTNMSREKERLDILWVAEDKEGIMAACDEITIYAVQFMQLIDLLGELGEIDEQEAIRLFEDPEQYHVLGTACETPGCHGKCTGASASGTSAIDDELDEWVHMWNRLRAAEVSVRDAWTRHIDILAKRCYHLRQMCRKLMRMLQIVRLGEDPRPADFEIDF